MRSVGKSTSWLNRFAEAGPVSQHDAGPGAAPCPVPHSCGTAGFLHSHCVCVQPAACRHSSTLHGCLADAVVFIGLRPFSLQPSQIVVVQHLVELHRTAEMFVISLGWEEINCKPRKVSTEVLICLPTNKDDE